VVTDAGSAHADTSAPEHVAASPVEDLLPLALSQPAVARSRALQELNAGPDARAASIAHQTLVIVDRDAGRLDDALRSARQALRYARRCDDARVADVLATYGATLVFAGRTADGLRRLQQAEPLTPPEQRPHLMLRRANVLYVAGRYDEALAEIDASITASQDHGDRLWTGRALNTRCLVRLARGEVAAAEEDAARAEEILGAVGQQLESAFAAHNRALAAHQRGDLPAALTLMDEVAARYAAIEVVQPDLVIDHAQALLTAGLAEEAYAMASVALEDTLLQPVKRAEIILTAAQAALAVGDIDAAQVGGHLAGRLFAAQRRPMWAFRARLLALQAQYLSGHPEELSDTAAAAVTPRPHAEDRRRGARMLRQGRDLVEALEQAGATELPVAQLLVGRIAHDAGRRDDAVTSLTAAAASRHTGSGLARAAGWLAAALLAELQGDRRALRRACRRGLDAVDEHRALLGDLELRALATRHGNELAHRAIKDVLAGGDARTMLWWVERWRATALTAARPPHGADGADDADGGQEQRVAALRDVSRRFDAADGAAADSLRRERDRRESEIRRAARHRRGADGGGKPRFDLDGVLADLGDTTLLTLAYVDDTLHAVTVVDGRVRRRAVGPLATALEEARYARFTLRRAAYGRLTDLADLAAAGRRLQDALLGPHVGRLAAARVVVVPPAPLLTAPWGLLPAFADTELTVSPSASLWHAAHRVPVSAGHLALVSGPGLSTGETEVTTLSPLYASARAVTGDAATVAGTLDLLEGARLAHIAAHGTFRADAPLFSSLELSDGPLTVHDLDRLHDPPREMVLSACDSGNAAPIGAHETLGLVSSLLAMGTSTVVASVVPVNDRATVEVMHEVHEVVRTGGSLAQGWLTARQAGRNDPLIAATAAAFTAWGA
jgi:CHAT domain-containing protein